MAPTGRTLLPVRRCDRFLTYINGIREIWDKFPFNPSETMSSSESRADLTLAAAMQVLTPLLPLLLREGVTYQRLSIELKNALLEVAPAVLLDSSIRLNDSSVSTLTGIHRKDVREWRSAGRSLPQAKTFGAVMTLFTRWSTDPAYCDAKGRPLVLERKGGPGTFEALAASVSNDVHSRTVLQELLRLGVAELVEAKSEGGDDRVRLCTDAFVPKDGAPEMLQLLSDNVGDHLAAAVQNVLGTTPPMLEQSIYANNLRPQSVEQMNVLARNVWQGAFNEIVRKATALSDKDAGEDGAEHRIRVGMYFYHAPDQQP